MAFCANCGCQMEGKFCAKCGASADAPPSPAATPPVNGAAPVAPSTPLAENVAAALCYSLMLITGVLFLVLEPYNKNRTIRFHAFQAIFVTLAMIVVQIALGIVVAILVGVSGSGWYFVPTIWLLFHLACLILWIFLILSAYQGKKVVLPVIGPLAEKQA